MTLLVTNCCFFFMALKRTTRITTPTTVTATTATTMMTDVVVAPSLAESYQPVSDNQRAKIKIGTNILLHIG